jgi:cytochrome c-type biogenesis protein CcmH
MKLAVPSDAAPRPPADYEVHPVPARTDSRRLAMLAGLVAFVTLSSLYLALRGTEKPLVPSAAPHAAPHAALMPANAQAPDVAAMVDRLAARMRQEPDNGAGWRMLAKSYAALGRFADSAAAYGKAAALLPPDAGLLADYADVSAMAQSGGFQGEPARLIRQALELDGRHPKALTLAGTEAYRRGDFGSAHRYWDKAMQVLPAESELAATVRGAIAELEARRTGRVAPAG